jgi:glycerophosphoryl diester phosphodiesterase
VLRVLKPYEGPAAIMSFNPEAGAWFARRAPKITRGLVVTERYRRGARARIERRLALWRARPDFLAYDVRDLPSRFASAQRARGLPVLTWTVRSRSDQQVASAHADQIIHELPQP